MQETLKASLNKNLTAPPVKEKKSRFERKSYATFSLRDEEMQSVNDIVKFLIIHDRPSTKTAAVRLALLSVKLDESLLALYDKNEDAIL